MNHLWPVMRIEAPAHPFRLGRVGANVGTALLLGHPHAERQPSFLNRRLLRLVVFAAGDLRRPFAKQLWICHQRRQRGVGHRQWAQMPRFELSRQVESRGTDLMPLAGFVAAVLPDRGMQAVGDAPPQQRVVGRMVLDDIKPSALPVVRAELRRFAVRQPRQFLSLVTHDKAPMRVQFPAHRLGKIFGELHQQRIAAPRIGARQWRRLVCYIVRQAVSFGLPGADGRCRRSLYSVCEMARDENPVENHSIPRSLLAAAKGSHYSSRLR